jgi:D-glycero-D-manno-heptose 1,7-bisphosphate phosphatase
MDRTNGYPPAPGERGMTFRACDRASSERPPLAPSPAVFLDRDGTLIVDRPYNGDPDKVQLLPGVPVALRLLRRVGFRLIVVTNQSGIARGFMDESDLRRVHRRLNGLLAARHTWVDAYYYCPHHVDGQLFNFAATCSCRKPGPGMILRAARDWSIDVGRSWMIGDMSTDVEAGISAGCRAIRIGSDVTGIEKLAANSLLKAATIVISDPDASPQVATIQDQIVKRGVATINGSNLNESSRQ